VEDIKSSPMPFAVKSNEVIMSFFDALKQVFTGKEVTRLEWGNPEIYVFLYEEKLTLHDDKGLHLLTVSLADMKGNDWVIREKKTPSLN
jgi:hypothetical protein